MRSYDPIFTLKPGSVVCIVNLNELLCLSSTKQFTSIYHTFHILSPSPLFVLVYYYTMVFARRSIFRAATAAQSFRAAPVARQSAQLLSRRFKSTGGSYEPGHASSDLPW